MSWSIAVRGEKGAVQAGVQAQRTAINYLVGKEEDIFKVACNLVESAVAAQPNGTEVSVSASGSQIRGLQTATVTVQAVA